MSKIAKRLSWEAADRIVKEASTRLKKAGIRFAFAGSWARKEKTVGDLDLLILSSQKEKAREVLKGIKGEERIEIYEANEDDWESQLLYLYGDGTFNIILRTLAKRKGYLLNQYGLFDRETNKRITTSEKRIFEILGLKWIPPEKRKRRR